MSKIILTYRFVTQMVCRQCFKKTLRPSTKRREMGRSDGSSSGLPTLHLTKVHRSRVSEQAELGWAAAPAGSYENRRWRVGLASQLNQPVPALGGVEAG